MDAGGLCVDDLKRLELAAAADAPGRVAATEVKKAVGIVAGRQGLEPWESFGILTRAGISSTAPGTD